MMAACLKRPGELELCQIPKPECPKGGILVKVMSCGICSADVKMIEHGHKSLRLPRIPGHEISGTVAESKSPDFQIGDKVQVPPGLSCKSCLYCLGGKENRCFDREIFGFTIDGGYSEYLAVSLSGKPSGSAYLLPDKMDYDLATLAEPLACCLNSFDQVDLQPGETILIAGAGPLGLLNALAAAQMKAKLILVSEPNPVRQKIALDLVADEVFSPQDLYQAVMKATHNEGVDIVVLACPNLSPDQKILSLLKPGGRVSLFSGPAPELSLSYLDIAQVHYQEIKISGSFGCTPGQNKQALKLLANDQSRFQKLITHRFPLKDVHLGLNAPKDMHGLKTVLEIGSG